MKDDWPMHDLVREMSCQITMKDSPDERIFLGAVKYDQLLEEMAQHICPPPSHVGTLYGHTIIKSTIPGAHINLD